MLLFHHCAGDGAAAQCETATRVTAKLSPQVSNRALTHHLQFGHQGAACRWCGKQHTRATHVRFLVQHPRQGALRAPASYPFIVNSIIIDPLSARTARTARTALQLVSLRGVSTRMASKHPCRSSLSLLSHTFCALLVGTEPRAVNPRAVLVYRLPPSLCQPKHTAAWHKGRNAKKGEARDGSD